jgi:hypothetical protein
MVMKYNEENETPAAYQDFQKAVREARPDLDFTFDPGPAFQAKWMFPGAKYGGSAMWKHGTRKLGWGIAQVDLDAWSEYEESCGREPRYT